MNILRDRHTPSAPNTNYRGSLELASADLAKRTDHREHSTTP